ncbi:MAG: sigma-54 dependent transcriptional regulator [Halothiobacillus sp.]|jgi:two-component system nitrogen regulation response regulator NtrX|nr:sigma-54 dependent transcriptional regulator [Halothiobacillus sp.]
MSIGHILVVDDEIEIRDLLAELLADEGYTVSSAADAIEARASIVVRRPDLILLDIWMPGQDGISLLREWHENHELGCPVIMMSGHGTVETAVEATRLGAFDFIEKPISLDKLLLMVEHGLENTRLSRENEQLRRNTADPFELVGDSDYMTTLRGQAKKVAGHDAWVLISGEPGTGKQALARYIHHHSPRRHFPFIDTGGVAMSGRQNAAAELFGSELDGKIRYGLLEQANGGSLFIAEAADMDEQTQMQLISALENQTFFRVGSTDPVQVDVRVIAATRKDLEDEVRQGRFREDLFYHLSVVPLHIEPLRHHPEDVPILLTYYLESAHRIEGLPLRELTIGARNLLKGHYWPGNVRELKNLVQRMLILGIGDVIDEQEVQRALGFIPASIDADQAQVSTLISLNLDLPLRDARDEFERRYLLAQLKSCEGSMTELARLTGMERTNLYRKLKSLGISANERS